MKLSIQPLLPTGNYLNKRYGIEMDFPDDSHIADNFKFLNDAVIAQHMAEFPFFYKDDKPLYLPQTAPTYSGEEEQPVIPGKKIVTTMGFSAYCDKINSCTTIEELQSMKPIADMNPKLVNVYNEKLKTFQS